MYNTTVQTEQPEQHSDLDVAIEADIIRFCSVRVQESFPDSRPEDGRQKGLRVSVSQDDQRFYLDHVARSPSERRAFLDRLVCITSARSEANLMVENHLLDKAVEELSRNKTTVIVDDDSQQVFRHRLRSDQPYQDLTGSYQIQAIIREAFLQEKTKFVPSSYENRSKHFEFLCTPEFLESVLQKAEGGVKRCDLKTIFEEAITQMIFEKIIINNSTQKYMKDLEEKEKKATQIIEAIIENKENNVMDKAVYITIIQGILDKQSKQGILDKRSKRDIEQKIKDLLNHKIKNFRSYFKQRYDACIRELNDSLDEEESKAASRVIAMTTVPPIKTLQEALRMKGSVEHVERGDIVIVSKNPSKPCRIVIVLKSNTARRWFQGVLVTNELPLATPDTLILKPKDTDLDYEIAVLAGLAGYMWFVDIDKTVGKINAKEVLDELDEIVEKNADAENKNMFQNSLRWPDLERESQVLLDLSQHCTENHDNDKIDLPYLDPQLLVDFSNREFLAKNFLLSLCKTKVKTRGFESWCFDNMLNYIIPFRGSPDESHLILIKLQESSQNESSQKPDYDPEALIDSLTELMKNGNREGQTELLLRRTIEQGLQEAPYVKIAGPDSTKKYARFYESGKLAEVLYETIGEK